MMFFAHPLEQRLGAGEGRLLPADHDDEARLARADIAAGHGGVERGQPFRGGRTRNLLRQQRAGGGHVHEHRAAFRRGDHAAGPEVGFLNIGRETDDGEDKVSLRRRRAGGVVPVRTGIEQRLGLGLGAVEDMQRVAGLKQVARHAAAHDTGADERDRMRRHATTAAQENDEDETKVIWNSGNQE
jgi:hypothetical protein